MSRTNFAVEGNVSATVKITAAPDGRSLIFTGSVHNQSSNAVRQVLFPDLMGLVPVGRAGGHDVPALRWAPRGRLLIWRRTRAS